MEDATLQTFNMFNILFLDHAEKFGFFEEVCVLYLMVTACLLESVLLNMLSDICKKKAYSVSVSLINFKHTSVQCIYVPGMFMLWFGYNTQNIKQKFYGVYTCGYKTVEMMVPVFPEHKTRASIRKMAFT